MQNLKSLRLFFSFFFFFFFVLALASEKISVKTMLKVDLFDVGPENILFAGMCVDFSTQKLYALGQWRG